MNREESPYGGENLRWRREPFAEEGNAQEKVIPKRERRSTKERLAGVRDRLLG
jgi:hypothetical protein